MLTIFRYLISILNINIDRLNYWIISGVGCLIISPTRELALQTNEVLKKLLVNIPLTHSLIIGGEKKLKEVVLLQTGYFTFLNLHNFINKISNINNF